MNETVHPPSQPATPPPLPLPEPSPRAKLKLVKERVHKEVLTQGHKTSDWEVGI